MDKTLKRVEKEEHLKIPGRKVLDDFVKENKDLKEEQIRLLAYFLIDRGYDLGITD